MGIRQSHLPWRRSSACRSEGETRPLVVGAVTTCCPFWVHTSVPQRRGCLDRSSHPPKLLFRTAHSVLTYLNFHDYHSRACLGPQSLTSKGGGHKRSGRDGSVRRPLSASTSNWHDPPPCSLACVSLNRCVCRRYSNSSELGCTLERMFTSNCLGCVCSEVCLWVWAGICPGVQWIL